MRDHKSVVKAGLLAFLYLSGSMAPCSRELTYSVITAAKAPTEPGSKSIEGMRKFSEQYARRYVSSHSLSFLILWLEGSSDFGACRAARQLTFLHLAAQDRDILLFR